MTETRFDVVGIGNAIVDVLTNGGGDILREHGLVKGTMTLVDAAAADRLYERMGPAIESSGGSAANTAAALASLGARVAFIGKVRDDQLGRVFQHDIRATGVSFDTAAAVDGEPTGRCLILVTPDAQRTMQTCLGASIALGPEDIDPHLITSSKFTYLEGYLWDPPRAKEACLKAARLSHEAGRMVVLSLSDPLCVDRHRNEFLDLVEREVDVLFANEDEIRSLYQVPTFDDALQIVRGRPTIVALTRSEKGSVIVAGDELHIVDAERVPAVSDTTGAGDAYAAGFLYGLTRGYDLASSARIGGIVAGEVIGQMGARPQRGLDDLVKDRMGWRHSHTPASALSRET